jgi:hypothetical protein
MKNEKKKITPILKSKKKSEVIIDSKTIPAVVDRTKAKSGRGLANEGTIVSYEEER